MWYLLCNGLTVGALHYFIPYSFGAAARFALNPFNFYPNDNNNCHRVKICSFAAHGYPTN